MNKKNILIIGPSWIGDMIMAQSLFGLIKKHNPNANIDVLAPDWTRALTDFMPEIRKPINLPLSHGEFGLKKRYEIGKLLRSENYDQAIVLPNSFKSALIPLFAYIPTRTGWKGEFRYGILNDIRILDKNQYPLMVERFAALGLDKNENLHNDYPIPKLQIPDDVVIDVIAKNHIISNAGDKIIGLCPGAKYGPSKRWLPEYYAEVANSKLAEGFQVWLFGDKEDASITKYIQDKTQNRCVDFAGKTTLKDAVVLLSKCNIVLTNDSGLMHVAAALDISLIAIYGSTSPGFTPPLSKKTVIFSSSLACSPCFKRECPLKSFSCMKETTTEKVLSAIKSMEM